MEHERSSTQNELDKTHFEGIEEYDDVLDGALYQKIANSDYDERMSMITKSSPIEQIRLLGALSEYGADVAFNTMRSSQNDGIVRVFDSIKSDHHFPPLTRIIAGNMFDDFSDLPDDMMDFGDEFSEVIEEDIEEDNRDKSILSNNKDLSFLYNSVHDNDGVKHTIEEQLGVSLNDISIEAEVQLLKYMTTANDKKYEKLCNALHSTADGSRVRLAESFLAADFGEDFGDSLLTIANSTRLDDTEKEQILDDFSSCRESIKYITGLYEHLGLNDKGEFAKEYARAANERLTDALTVFSEIAKKGYAEADLGWAGNIRLNSNTAREAMGYEKKSLEIISGTFKDVIAGKAEAYARVALHPDEEFQRLRRTVYDLYSPDHGHVLIYTRADGSHSFDADIEYGKVGSKYNENSKNTGVEASISMIADPINPFSTINPYKPNKFALKNLNYYDDVTMNKVSAIRLDREGRAPGWAADDSRRDPVNRIGTISVDLVAIGDREDTPSGKIARLLAVGNTIRALKRGGETSLNHNTNWFDQAKYGTTDGFMDLVNKFDRSMNLLVEEHPSRLRLKKLGGDAMVSTVKKRNKTSNDDPAA